MARRSSGGRGRGGSWLTACFFPSSSGTEHGDALNPEKCTCVYVVTADYQRQEKTEISLTAGEKVEVIEKSESGWWFVRTAEEQGWVPATYLVSLTGRRESHKSLNGEPEWYVTVQSFSSSSQDELGFKSGVIVEVIQRNLEGWWFIRYGGKEGWAPAAYLKKIQNGVTSSNQATETNKPAVQGQVEIIGNLMEISNLLNKKPINHTNDPSAQLNGITSQHSTSSDSNVDSKNTHNDRDSNSTTSSVSHSDCEDPVSQQKDKSPSISVSSVSGSDAGVSSSSCVSSSLPSSLKNKTIPPSPAIARVVPQRFHSVETKSASNSYKPPPRRENSLGFQLPEPPEPPTVEAEYYTIAEFRSCLTDGISFSGGQKAEVIEKNSGGWWYVQIGEKEGWAPCSYIDKRKKPSLMRQTSTLTRPKVPPPAPPIKKQNSLSCVESVVMSSESLRIYEEPEYDVPTIGLEIDAELEFLPGDGPTKAPPPLSQRKVSFTLGGGDGEDYDGVYAIGGFRDENSPSGTHRVSMYDPPEYDAPTIEPSIESTAVYAHSKHSTLKQQADELKSKPSVLPKPTNPECGSLRRPPKSTQPEQHFPYRSSRTSEESANGFSSEDTMGFHNSAQEAFNEQSCVLYRTTMAYQREEPCELSFPAGVEVEVLEKQESGWWFVRWANEEGWVPTYYLQPIKSSDKSELEDSDKVEPSSCWAPTPELEIAVQVDVANVGKSILEKNEQRVSQSLKVSHRSNQQNCRVGVKQLAVRPQNVLMTHTKDKANGTLTNARTTQRNDTLPNQTSFHSYTDQSTSSGETMRRKVPISMVKPKPHLIHNNLREEYVSIADYHGDAETMSFPAGTRLEVLERNPNGWWYCRVLDSAKLRKGWVPSNFLERKS